MTDIEDISGDGGVQKTILSPGEGSTSERGARIWIRYCLSTLEGKELDARKFSFRLGRGVVIRGLETLCQTMKLKEKCEAILSPYYAFGDKGFKGEAKGEKVKLEVELLAMEGGSKDILKMGAGERFALAIQWKQKGNAFFKDVKYEKAKIQYEKCLSCLEYLFYKVQKQDEESYEKTTTDEEEHSDDQRQEMKERGDFAQDLDARDTKIQDVMKEDGGESKQQLNDSLVTEENESLPKEGMGDQQQIKKETGPVIKESQAAESKEQLPDMRDTTTATSKEAGKTNSLGEEPEEQRASGEAIKGKEKSLRDPTEKEIRIVQVAALNNLALTLFKLGDNKGAVNRASSSLQLSDNTNYKAIYYRGRALVQLGMWDEARRDLVAAAKVAPKNMGIRIELNRLEKKVQQHKAKEKKAAAAMFG